MASRICGFFSIRSWGELCSAGRVVDGHGAFVMRAEEAADRKLIIHTQAAALLPSAGATWCFGHFSWLRHAFEVRLY